MRILFLLSLGILFVVIGCATGKESTYSDSFYDQRPWMNELSYDNDTMSDFEILDISPQTAKDLSQNMDVMKDDILEIIKP